MKHESTRKDTISNRFFTITIEGRSGALDSDGVKRFNAAYDDLLARITAVPMREDTQAEAEAIANAAAKQEVLE